MSSFDICVQAILISMYLCKVEATAHFYSLYVFALPYFIEKIIYFLLF